MQKFLWVRDKILWLGQRVIVFFALLYAVFFISADYHNLASKGRGAALSRLMPAHDFLIGYLQDPTGPYQYRLKDFIHYYEQLLEYMPYTADAFAMLGFVQYHMGEQDKALASYQRAIELNPIYFWFYYNKGLIHFERGEFEEADAQFRKAMATDPENTMSFAFMSKVFMPVRDVTHDYGGTIHLRLQKAYKDCFKLIVMSRYFLNDYPGVLSTANYAVKEKFDDERFYLHYSGLAAYHMGQFRTAATLLQRSLSHGSGSREGYKILAATWESLGRPGLARQFITEAEQPGLPESPFAVMKDTLVLQIF